jgi:MORN repeat
VGNISLRGYTGNFLGSLQEG